MIRCELSTFIDRPLENVFAYLSDFGNLRKYEPFVEEIQLTSAGPIGVGSTWRHVRRMGRRRIEAPIEFTEFEPNARLAIRSEAGRFRVYTAQSFKREGGGTRVDEVLEMYLAGPLRLMEPLVRRQVKSQMRVTHQRMKEAVEAAAD